MTHRQLTRRDRKNPTLAAGLAATLALGSLGALSAWQETQEFTIEASSKTLSMSYAVDYNKDGIINSEDGDTAWTAFGSAFQLANLTGLGQGEHHDFHIYFKNNGSHVVENTVADITPSGTAFEGLNPATSGWATDSSPLGTVLNPVGEAGPFIINLDTPADWPESYSGSIFEISIITTWDLYTAPESGGGDGGDGEPGDGGNTGETYTPEQQLTLQIREDMRTTITNMWAEWQPYALDHTTTPWGDITEVVSPITTVSGTVVQTASGWGTTSNGLMLVYGHEDLQGVIVAWFQDPDTVSPDITVNGGDYTIPAWSWQYNGPDFEWMVSIP